MRSTEKKADVLVTIAGLPEGDPRLVAVSKALAGRTEADCILSRRATAERFNRSTRTLAFWAKQGILRPVILPGRKRACGFRASDVAALIGGAA
jgi:hypothetical protein